MRSVRFAAALLLAAAGAAPAQAPAAAAPDTFRAEDLSVLVPAGLPQPVQEFANATALRFSARNPAQTRGMQVVVGRREIRVARTIDRTAALDTFVLLNVARTQADSMPFTYVRETVPADTGALLATGVRATVMAPGRTLRSWSRYYVTRTGTFRWASVVVVDASGADPYDDPEVQRTMRSVAFALPARPAAREVTLSDIGIAFTLPEGVPDLQRVPADQAAAPIEYEAVSPDDGLTFTVSEIWEPVPSAGMPESMRARVLQNLLNATPGTDRHDQIFLPVPGWIMRSQSFIRIIGGRWLAGAVQRAYAPSSGDMRIVVINLHRIGAQPIADDPRVQSFLASLHFVPRHASFH